MAGEQPWLYAVGDVNGISLLTHMGKYQARACGDLVGARALGRAGHGVVDDAVGHRPRVPAGRLHRP